MTDVFLDIFGKMPKTIKPILFREWSNKIILLLAVLFISYGIGYATVVTAVSSNKWTSGSTWDTGTSPSCGDTIVIPSGVTVTVDVQINLDVCPDPTFILVEGTLDFKNGKKIYMSTGSGVTIAGSGQITGGGGGSANVINIGGTDVWNSGSGDITTPTTLGEPFGIVVKSITTGDYHNPSTWDCNCIPDTLNTAIVRSVDAVTLSGSASIFNLIINGSLIIQGSNQLYVSGSWTNNGTFTANQSTISFGATNSQVIAGVRDQEFYNIHIKNGCVLTNSAGLLNLRGIMTFNNGSFTTSDSLNLISDANGTGAIGSLSSGSLTGNVFSNRYVMGGATGWRFLTSCIQGSTLSDIDDDIITAGVPGSDYPTFSFVSIWDYDETVLGNKDSGYVVPPSMGQAISPGKGFWVYAGDNLTGTAAFNIDFYGAINQGAINLPVSYTVTPDTGDGWNLVANPYPCAIDWDDPNWTKIGISDETHIFNPNTGTYAVYAGGIGANGGSNVIASNQAFWVKAIAPVLQLTANEGCKISDNSDPFKSSSQPSMLRIFCKKDNQTTFNDEIVLNFNPNISKSRKLANKFLSTNDSVLNIMFKDGNVNSAIFESAPTFDTIPLELNGNSSDLIVSFKDVNFLENWWSVYLLDNATNTKYPIDGDLSIQLNKSVVGINSDLSLILIPKVEFTTISPTCKYSKNGSVSSNSFGMDNYLSLNRTDNNELFISDMGQWKNLLVGEYHAHVGHPIDGALFYDSIFELSPLDSEVTIESENVVYNPQDLAITDSYQSNYWLWNGQPISSNSDSISADYFETHTGNTQADLVQCIYVDDEGCEKAHSWVVYTNNNSNIYPNPYKNGSELNVYLDNGENSIEVFNLNGQVVWSTKLYTEFSGHQKIIGMALAKGQYLMKISGEESVVNLKLLVNE